MAFGDQDLTASNSAVVFSFTGAGALLVPAPVQLQGFGADRMFETEAVEMAETVMGVDGRMSTGFVPNPVPQTYTIQADSPFGPVLDLVINAQRINRTIYRFNASIAIPSISRLYTLTRGAIVQSNVIPGAARILEPRTFRVMWQQVIATPTA